MAKSSLNVGLLCTGTGIELHCFTQAGFPGARIATQPLTLEEVVLTKGKKSIFTVMSSATFVLNVLISSNLTTLKILPSGEASAGPTSENNTNIVAVTEDSTPVENSVELFTPPPASDNATTADHDISQAGSTLSTHEESPERSRSRSPLNKADVRKKSG